MEEIIIKSYCIAHFASYLCCRVHVAIDGPDLHFTKIYCKFAFAIQNRTSICLDIYKSTDVKYYV